MSACKGASLIHIQLGRFQARADDKGLESPGPEAGSATQRPVPRGNGLIICNALKINMLCVVLAAEDHCSGS